MENFTKVRKYLKCIFEKRQKVPQHILYDDFFRCEKSARILGLRFMKSRESSPNKWIKINNIAFEVAIVVLLIAEIISFISSIQQKLFFTSIDNALFYGGFFVVAVKIYVIFYRNRENLDAVIEKLDEHFPHYGVDQIIFKAENYLKVLKRFERIYYVIFATAGLQFCLMPFLHQIYGATTSISVEWMTVYELALPFDQQQPVVYEVLWALESWIFACTILYIVTTDLLFACLCQILTMEFDILGQVMSEIDITDGEDEAIKELKELTKIHQELIEVSETLNEIFSPLLLINVFGSITALCTACFLLVSGISGYLVVKYVLFPICLTIQIFIHCFFSQRIIDSSASVAVSVYNSDWYAGSVTCRRHVLQVMLRAQKAQSITGWKFFDVSMEIFQWIILTSYSYYSVLQGTYGS